MTTDISPRDWQLLSEYIDHQLSPKAQLQLEARLGREPQLRGALQDLRRCKILLLSQPRLYVPHNFTLSPQMAKIRPMNPIYPVVRLAAALASILLVLVLAGDLVSGGPVRATYRNILMPMAAQPASLPAAEEEVIAVELEKASEPMSKSLPQATPSIPPPAAPMQAPVGGEESPTLAAMEAQPMIATEALAAMDSGPAETARPEPTSTVFAVPEALESQPALRQAPSPMPSEAPQPAVQPVAADKGTFSITNLAILGLELLLALLAVLAWLAAIFFGRSG